jgi:hypothetical protein
LWKAGIANEEKEKEDEFFERTSSKWDKLGFQGQDPATDLRGGGILALEIFVDFVESNPELVRGMQEHCKKQIQLGSMNWLLIACASINITVTLFFRQQVNASSVVYGWSRPILMAMMRGSSIMQFHPDAKIAEKDRAGYLPTPEDYANGIVRVALPNNYTRKNNQQQHSGNDECLSSSATVLEQREKVFGISGNELKSEFGGAGMENQWTLFKSICRVHHYLMRNLFREWVEKGASVMEFEQFILKNVYKPFFEDKETIVL